MRADWTTRRRDGVTLVEVVLESARRRRVIVENACDGPAWPPRENGVPASGWDAPEDDATVPGHGDPPAEGGADRPTFAGVVDGRRGLGYATPAEPAEPPVRIDWGAPVESGSSFGSHPDVPTVGDDPAAVVRALGRAGPPRAAVPGPDTDSDSRPRVARADGGADADADVDADADGAAGGSDASAGDDPAALFVAVERRLERGERLASAETLPEVSEAVAAVDGLDGVRDLETALREDVDRLRAVEERARDLRERVAALDVPVERLERLA